jgi:hypothetical protein
MLKAASDLEIEAIKAVMVVPTLAPITKGKAFLIDNLSAATRGTIREVAVELECMVAVKPAPHNSEATGELNTYLSILFCDSPITSFFK